MGAFYLKVGVKVPRIASTLKHSAVLRHGRDSERLMMIIRREKVQGWRLISISCFALAAPHRRAQQIHSQHDPSAPSGAFQVQERQVAQGQLGWEPRWCGQAGAVAMH